MSDLQFGGGKRDRTADLLHAMQALSQLSYTPGKSEVGRTISEAIQNVNHFVKNSSCAAQPEHKANIQYAVRYNLLFYWFNLPMSVGHYENFPVGSWLIPAKIRGAIHAIYHFARFADDIADEGDDPPSIRLKKLAECRQALQNLERGQPATQAPFIALEAAIQAHQLPYPLLYDLLDAFEQDVSKTRYADMGEVIAYCRRSANPIGRLLLHLFGETDPKSLAMSDGICTALQLTNFLQDIAIDWQKGRVYLPQEDLRKYRINEAQIANADTSGLWSAMMQAQVKRARNMLAAGAPLGKRIPGRCGLELRMIILGGETILRKIHESSGDIFTQRPVLTPRDWLYMLYRAVRAK